MYAARVRRAGLVVLALLAATSVWAQSDGGQDDAAAQAAALAVQADSKARAGDFVGAATLFKQAHALDARAEYQCNVGIAYYKAKELPRAQLYLGICLTRGSHLPEQFVAQVRGALGAVEDKLRKGDFTPVDLVVSPTSAEVRVSSFAADEAFIGSRTVWLPFGAHTLEVSAAGHVGASLPLALATRDRFAARVELAPEPEVVAIDAGVVEAADAAPRLALADAAPPQLPRPAPPSRVPAYVATGAAVVVAGATLFAYGRARDAADAAGLLTEEDGHAAAADDARARRTLAYAGYAVTAAAVLTTGYLWWRVTRAPADEVTVAPGLSADGAGPRDLARRRLLAASASAAPPRRRIVPAASAVPRLIRPSAPSRRRSRSDRRSPTHRWPPGTSSDGRPRPRRPRPRRRPARTTSP